MLGRRLDRYVTVYFVWYFVLCLTAVIALYVVIDTFTKLDEFLEHEGLLEKLRWILTYHLYQIPVLLGQFLPIVTLMAGIICLARLARYNELNAMKASGVSLHRALLPILLCSLVIGALAAANQELLVPDLESDIRTVRVEALKRPEVYDRLYVYDAVTHTTVYIHQLDNAAQGLCLTRLEATPRRTDGPDPPPPAFQAGKAMWGADCIYLLRPAAGRSGTFRRKALLTHTEARDYRLPAKPPARLADGTPAYQVAAKLGEEPYDVKFAACEPVRRLHLLRRAVITGAYRGAETAPPIELHAALWYDAACRKLVGDPAAEATDLWLAQGQSYVQIGPTKRARILYGADPVVCGTPPNASEFASPPERLTRSSVDPSLSSFAKLRQMARDVPTLRQRILIVLHSRIAFPLASFVLLLVAIPFLFQAEGGKSTWLGALLALFVSLSFYFMTYMCEHLGRIPGGVFASAPWLAAWLPVAIFGTAGALLLRNMDT